MTPFENDLERDRIAVANVHVEETPFIRVGGLEYALLNAIVSFRIVLMLIDPAWNDVHRPRYECLINGDLDWIDDLSCVEYVGRRFFSPSGVGIRYMD